MAETTTTPAPVLDPVQDPANPAVKAGYKTTQFYITAAVMILGAMMTAGVFDVPDAPPWLISVQRMVGVILAVAKGLGYTMGRETTTRLGIEKAAEVAVASNGTSA